MIRLRASYHDHDLPFQLRMSHTRRKNKLQLDHRDSGCQPHHDHWHEGASLRLLVPRAGPGQANALP
eukprot:2814120-Rhodomonas_salina.3